jgi:hypothetical protein
MRMIATVALLGIVAMSTSGCAAVLLGYVVADGINKSKATETCRANLKTTNDERIAQHKDIFPDQCGQ